MSKNIVIANWKMNPEKSLQATKLYQATFKKAGKFKKTEIVVAPPNIYFPQNFKKNKNLKLGAQDAFFGVTGSSTGEVSSLMLKNLGVTHVILGHSERRALGEGNDLISKKLTAVLKESMTPILCIGERERDPGAQYLTFLIEQLKSALSNRSKKDMGTIIIAYEPVWAIGKTAVDAMDAHKLHVMTIFIQKVITGMYGREVAAAMKIIYGGSVEGSNAFNLLHNGNVSGFLVGHASLDAEEFGEILSAVEQKKNK